MDTQVAQYESSPTALMLEPGVYKCRSASTQGLHTIWVNKAWRRIDGRSVLRLEVMCSCPGGTFYRDDNANSICRHGIAVMERLLANPSETDALPEPINPDSE